MRVVASPLGEMAEGRNLCYSVHCCENTQNIVDQRTLKVDIEPREHSEHSWCSINTVNIKRGDGGVGEGW